MDTDIARSALSYLKRSAPLLVLEHSDSFLRHSVLSAFPCKRYKMISTADICKRCKDDPIFKQSLYASYLDGQAVRGNAICEFLGPMIGDRTVECCGGKKKTVVGIFTCALLGRKIAEPTCWVCSDYEAK